MKLLFLIISLATFSLNALAGDEFNCAGNSQIRGVVFEFSVWRFKAVPDSATIKLCDLKGEYFFLVKSRRNSNYPEEIAKFPLRSESVQSVLSSYDSALGFNPRDTESGFDGSSWCLTRPGVGTHLEVCFWAPKNRARERGLESFVNFGQMLWSTIGFESKYGSL